VPDFRSAGLLSLAGVVCAAASGAAAAPAPTLYRVTVSGTAHQEWDHTAAPVTEGGCERTQRSEGIRRVTFRTKASAILRVSGGRFLPADLGAVAGAVSLVGANTDKEVCGTVGMESIADCAPTKRSFAGARLRVAGPAPGVLVVRSVRNVRLRRAQCPREPAEVVRAPLGPIPITLRVSTRTLANPRVVRITLTARATRTTTYRAPEAGTQEVRSAWALTLVRVS
jgi:hypothetical protein